MQDELIKKIRAGCDALGQSFDAARLQQCAALLTELERWSHRVNLTAVRDIGEMISAHLLDSLSVRPFLQGNTIIDIGTGAGFPGLPLAIAEPGRSFVLLDGNHKKISFVQHMVTRLRLTNVRAVKARAEDYAPGESFDTVIARALAPIPRIIEFGGHLLAEKGVVLALKGKFPGAELTDALANRWDWETEKISVPGLEQHSRHIVMLKKKG